MKLLFSLVVLAFLRLQGLADWAVTGRESLPGPAGLAFTKVGVSTDGVSADLHLVRFNAKTSTFAVMDDPKNAYNLGSAAQKRGVLAAVNGGYFHPDRTPLGLVVRQGQTLHPVEKAKLLSGIVVVTREKIALLRPVEFKASSAVREALQAGPFLVDDRKPVAGLNADRRARRTFVFTEGSDRFGFGVSDSLTLAEIGQVLAMPGLLPDGKIARALNLDGGTSTGLWVGGEKPFYLRELEDVRNFLGVVPR